METMTRTEDRNESRMAFLERAGWAAASAAPLAGDASTRSYQRLRLDGRPAVLMIAPPGAEVTCKWPNDVFLNHRKTAGLLLESSTSGGAALDWLVIGMGVNIVSAPSDVAQPVTSLAEEGCSGLTPDSLLESFCSYFAGRYEQWLADGFTAQREAWLQRAEGRGGPVTVNLEGESFVGLFVDIDESGALIVDTASAGRRVVTAGEVFIP